MLFNYSLIAAFGLALAEVSYKGQQVLDCQVSDRATAQKFEKFDIFNEKNGITTVRVKNEEQFKQANQFAKCSVRESNLENIVSKQSRFIRRDDAAAGSLVLSDEDFFKNYQSYETIKAQFQHWAKKYNKYATFNKSIGKTVEGRDIFSIDITDKTRCGKKKDIVYLAGLHAREWIAPATASYIANRLLVEAETDKQVQSHLRHFVYRIIPSGNPDGYEYTRNTDRLWRKNRRNNGDGTFGVDLNRNFDNHWGVVGASNDTSDETYLGTAPHSEPEVASITKYVSSLKHLYGAIDWHAYGQLILRNWGWTMEPSTNEAILAPMGDKIKAAIDAHGYNFTSQLSAGLYPAGGAADDWFAENAKAVSLTLELCPDNDDIGFELPPKDLLACAKASYDGSKVFSQFLIDNPNIPHNGYTTPQV
ncbi:putative carboxypeptidase precursor [Conidiobolus coronatus NRRL 28638]|uniref:Putative carboxypeptidase n=1 Tax=Conidiobolus coronatus (strain ATCC 28846 / CBS 209.66 / NRRL 28638) TaxID=796925 RepID=A0A137NQU5_CONC2|nr:putative carboxypeptidase precursor [Conidiobolus coronatus NRRL 28638]|eukprot:KXN65050.1 putative carboxypeptidase precursor [Conidiobolus coronatus NRRL 28638]